jgi:hypothetical protein
MASGVFDYQILTGNFDYQTDAEYPNFETSTAVLANYQPDQLVDMNKIYGYENLNDDQVVGLELIS